MPGHKKCSIHLSIASFPLQGLWEPREKLLKKKMQCLLRVNFGKAYPTRYFWEASAKHDLNMCRRDLFKVGLDNTCKAICGSKQPVGLELFGDDLTDRLKTVKESNKAAKQLTGHKRKSGEEYSRSSYSARSFFLFHQRGNHHQGYPRRRINY